MRALFLLLVLSLVSGCATKYQAKGFGGGFTETQLDKNVFRVAFSGNAYTPGQQAEEMALLRSAEIGVKHGFTHFVLADSRIDKSISTYTSPATVSTGKDGKKPIVYGGDTTVMVMPSAINTVVYYGARPDVKGLVYDVQFICSSLGRKYEVACGAN